MQRVCQQRLPFGLRFRDQRVAVSDGDKASVHVVDEKRDTPGMAAVARGQGWPQKNAQLRELVTALSRLVIKIVVYRK
jgi:hypothetical protein